MSKRTLNNSVRKNCTDMILSDIDFEGMLNSARYTVTRYVTGTGSCDKFDFKVSKDNNKVIIWHNKSRVLMMMI